MFLSPGAWRTRGSVWESPEIRLGGQTQNPGCVVRLLGEPGDQSMTLMVGAIEMRSPAERKPNVLLFSIASAPVMKPMPFEAEGEIKRKQTVMFWYKTWP